MKLSLINFRCHKNLKLKLPDTGLVLLSGPSGVGKSTVLNAIVFALYGKVKKPYTFGVKKGCSVVMEYKDLYIQRSRTPNVLSILIDNQKWEDEPAETKIQEYLGNGICLDEIEFMASSYIRQKQLGSLLYMAGPQQLSFIEHLAFSEVPIEKLREICGNYIKDIKQKNSNIDSQLELIKTQIIELEAKTGKKFDKKQINVLKEKSKTIHSEYAKNMEILSLNQKSYDEQQQLEKLLLEQNNRNNQLKEQLSKLPNISEKKINKLEKKLKTAENTLYIYNNKIQLELELSTLEKNYDTNELQKEINNLKNLDLDDIPIVEKVINDYDTLLSELNTDVTDLNALEKEYNKKSIKKRLKEYKELLVSIQVLKCPNCKCSLIMKNNELESVNSEKIKSEESIDSLNNKIYNLEKKLKKSYQINDIISKIRKLNPDRDKLQKLKKLQKYRMDLDKYTEIHIHNKSSLIAKIQAIKIGDVPSEKKIEKIKNKLSINKKNWIKHQELQRDLANDIYANSIKALQKNDTKITESELNLQKLTVQRLSVELQEFTKNSDLLQEYSNFKQSKKDLKNKRKVAEKLNTDKNSILSTLEGFTTLFARIKDAEHISIENTVMGINNEAGVHLEEMFDDPIKIEMQTYRQTKTTKSVKPQINTSIEYRGFEYDSLDQISGGEQDRVSLAYTVALSSMFRSPILLLDECLSSLDKQLNTHILERMKQLSCDKLILVVSHEAERGLFDKIIEM